MSRPDFAKEWASSRLTIPTISDPDYALGLAAYLGSQPPTTDDHDYIFNLQDKRSVWLGEQMLLAVGHEWQDDVTYDAYAITRSPVDGQLYRSLVGGNLGNEPSVSGAKWASGLGNEVPSSLLASGIAGSFSNLKASATGLSALVTVTADSLCLKNASNEQVVVNALALSINSAAVGANGLDTGVLAASTWYAVWVIWNGTTTAGLLSLSATAPTMPAGYTYKARTGWIRTDASANKYPLAFNQAGRFVVPVVGGNVPGLPQIASGAAGNTATPTYVNFSWLGAAPADVVSLDVITTCIPDTSLILATSSSRGGLGSLTNPPEVGMGVVVLSAAYTLKTRVRPLSGQLFWACTAGGSVHIAGWELNI